MSLHVFAAAWELSKLYHQNAVDHLEGPGMYWNGWALRWACADLPVAGGQRVDEVAVDGSFAAVGRMPILNLRPFQCPGVESSWSDFQNVVVAAKTARR
jgi:hypothetical protein